MSVSIQVPRDLIERTVAELRAATETERVVLWLGERLADHIVARELFVPVQQARADVFQIPREGIQALLRHLHSRGFMVAAQVHTHPEEAFHSLADDRWAIVRHVGALSIVVPRFCQETTPDTFARDSLVYRFSERGEFVLVEAHETYVITP